MQKDCFFRFVSAVVLVHISWVSGTDTFDEARKLEEARKELEEASQELEEASRALDAEAWKEAREALEARQRGAWKDPSRKLWDNLPRETRQYWKAEERHLREGSSKRLWEAASKMASTDDQSQKMTDEEWASLEAQLQELQEKSYKRKESQKMTDEEWASLEAQLEELQENKTLPQEQQPDGKQPDGKPDVKPEDIKLNLGSGNLNDSLEDNLGSKCIFCFACSAFVLGLYAAVLFGLYKKRHVSKAQKQGSSKQVRFSS